MPDFNYYKQYCKYVATFMKLHNRFFSNLCWSWLGNLSILLDFLFQMAFSEFGKADQRCPKIQPPGAQSCPRAFKCIQDVQRLLNLFPAAFKLFPQGGYSEWLMNSYTKPTWRSCPKVSKHIQIRRGFRVAGRGFPQICWRRWPKMSKDPAPGRPKLPKGVQMHPGCPKVV